MMNSSVTFCMVLVNVFFRGDGWHDHPVPASIKDHIRTHDSERIQAATIAHHEVYKKFTNPPTKPMRVPQR